jgi:hypothetical protein
MNPDVFVTVAFSGYAVVVVLGIVIVLRAVSQHHGTGRDYDGSDE